MNNCLQTSPNSNLEFHVRDYLVEIFLITQFFLQIRQLMKNNSIIKILTKTQRILFRSAIVEMIKLII